MSVGEKVLKMFRLIVPPEFLRLRREEDETFMVSFTDEIIDWCNEFLTGKVHVKNIPIVGDEKLTYPWQKMAVADFTRQSDAILFKMRWL